MEQQRIGYLDIAKGIGIILVVLHHTSGKGSFPNIYISSFHMPLFFIISGMCFNELRYARFSGCLKRKCRVLLWPLAAFSVLMLAMSWLAGSSFYTVGKLMDGRLPSAYWFVWILFLAELAYYAVCRLCKSKPARICMAGIMLAVGLVRQHYDVALPLYLPSLFYAIFFYAIGNIFYAGICRALHFKCLMGGVILPLISVFFLHEGLDLSSGYVASPWLASVPIASLATLGLLSACSNLPKGCAKARSILKWFGRNTFVILMVHMFAINLSCMYMQPLVGSHALYKVVEQFFVWGVSLSFAWLVNNHAKWMLGKW